MTSQFFDNLGPVDSTMEVFQTAFAKSSAFFISLGLLIVLSRVFVRFTTANYRGALTNDQIALLVVASVTLGFAHLFLCWAYTSHDVKGFTTAPSIYLAVCWSMATLLGVCGGLGVGLSLLIGTMRAI